MFETWETQSGMQALNYYGLQQARPQAPIVVAPSARIQAVLLAGAVRAACDLCRSEIEASANRAVEAAKQAITPLPEREEITWVNGWFRNRKVVTKIIPSENEQRQHKKEMEARADAVRGYYRVPETIKTLAGLSAHFPDDQPMPLEGDYITAIAPYLKPHAAVIEGAPNDKTNV